MAEKPKSRPIMGKNALMIKTNLECIDDSQIIKNIVLGKYSPTLQHYIDRMQQRRKRSRLFSENTSTYSSISSAASSNGFWFPNMETLKLSLDSLQFNEPFIEETSNQKRRSYIRTSPISHHITHGHMNYSDDDEENKLSDLTDHLTDSDDTHDYLEELKVDLAVRNEILFQVSKALMICKESRNFAYTYNTEYLEAERILLITSLTKDALVGEINNIEFNNYIKPVRNAIKADLKFFHVEFHPKVPDNSIYLLIMTCGCKVIASDITEMNKIDGKLRFEEEFDFECVTTDFFINFLLYEMPIEVEGDKIGKCEPVINCNPLKKLFHLTNGSNKKWEMQRLKPSAFKLRATSSFSPSHIPKPSNAPSQEIKSKLTEIPKPSSSLLPELTLKFSKDIHWETTTGFLTIGIENKSSCIVWNRRWCRLNGPELKYWNYPSEDKNPSLNVIDLGLFSGISIGTAGRDVCPRPRTLILIADRNYFLCADNEVELGKWKGAIDDVLVTVSIWK